MLNADHDVANKGKIKGQLFLEHTLGFYKTFKKITKKIGFHITFETADLQDIIFTSIGDNIKVMIISSFVSSHFIYQVLKLKLCLMNLFKLFIEYLMTVGIKREDLLPTQNIKSILVQLNLVILLKI